VRAAAAAGPPARGAARDAARGGTRVALPSAWLESVRRASECALLGIAWFVCSLPVVTAGAAWAAVAHVCHAWSAGEEPPLARTFCRAVRRELAPGVVLGLLGCASVALPYLEARTALAARLPGALPESVALGLLGAAWLAVLLLAFGERASAGTGWRESLRRSARLCRERPLAPAGSVIALAIGIVLVLVFPPLIVLIAGPVGYAVSAIHARASAPASRQQSSPGRR
jgi:hypothetical protein